tara:strand:- start:242 stop:1147 length:906 start_codon:yes stop_codon:yes gene_type:complete
VSLNIHKHNDKIYWFDVMPKGEENFISVYLIVDEKITLIETGPSSSNASLVNGIRKIGIELEDIDFIVPTHIHLDHFGGGGHIVEMCPNSVAVLHPKAVKHVSEIDEWWTGSRDFLGEVADLYGKPKPIPPDRVISADEGFVLNLGTSKLQSLHTPGHAPHHITWIYDGEAFVGDSAGLWYPELNVSFPVTPGYYRHDLALDSIDKMLALQFKYLHYTHFGPRLAEGALEQIKFEFEIWINIIENGYRNNLSTIDMLNILFKQRDGLKRTHQKHGIHQAKTHLGSVEGMLNWVTRKDAQSR